MLLTEYLANKGQRRELATVTVDAHISSIYEEMRERRVKVICVTNQGDFVGLVDQMSLLNGIMLSPQHFNSLEAKDIMKTSIPVLKDSDEVEDLIEAMKKRQVDAIPFYQSGKLVYLFTQDDLMNILDQLLAEHHGLLAQAEAKGEIFMANPLVQKIMNTLSDVGI